MERTRTLRRNSRGSSASRRVMARATGQVAYVGVVRASDFTAVATYAHMDVVNTDGVRLLLKSQASIEPRKLYVSKTEQILVAYYGDERGRVYVAATLKDYPTRLAYLLLEELQSKFLTKAGDKVHNAAEDSLSRSCRGIFREICERYAHPSEVDHLSALQQQLDTVTTTMQDNIKSMLQNEHKLQDILAQSEHLTEQASMFQAGATKVRQEMRWRVIKQRILIAVIVVVVLAVIITPTAIYLSKK